MKIFRRKQYPEISTFNFKPILNFWILLIMAISCTVGSGSYVLIGNIASYTGLSSYFTFAIATLVSLFICLPYAEFAARIPSSGCQYAYVYNSLGEIFAVLASICLFEADLMGIGCVSRGWAEYIFSTLQSLGIHIPSYLISINFPGISEKIGSFCLLGMISIIVFTIVALCGIKNSAFVNSIITLINQFTLILSIFVGFYYFNINNLIHTPFTSIPINIAQIPIAFFILTGFDQPTCFVLESINPKKNIPRSMIVCVIYATILNVLIITLFLGTMNIDPSKKKHLILLDIFIESGNHWMPGIIGVGSLIGISSVILANLMAYPQVLITYSDDGMIPSFFSRLNNRGVAVNAILLTSICALFFASFINIDINAEISSLGCLIGYSLVDIGVLVKRYEPKNVTWFFYFLLILLCIISYAFGFYLYHYENILILNLIIIVILLLIPFVFYFSFEQVDVPKLFSCPFVPFIPMFGCAINLIILGGISSTSWILHGFCSIIFLLIYIFYGIEHTTFKSENDLLINNSLIDNSNSTIN